MNSGIYCKVKSSDKVYNSILIDEYNKCISGACNSKTSNLKYSNSDMNSSDSSSVTTELLNNNKWKCGMNVRARYSEDGEYYEAIIENIWDNKYASVRFLAYENDEIVKLKYLKPSHGEKAIEEQCEAAKRDKEEDDIYESDECDDSWKEIDWKVGMTCRAMYDGNNTIYEATVQKVNSYNRTAVLLMTGFDKPFEAKFEDMYESIPEYREKQKKTAEKLKATRTCDVPVVSTFLNNTTETLESKTIKNETVKLKENMNLGSSSSTVHINDVKVPINSCNHCSHTNYCNSQPELNVLPPSINNTSVFSQCQGMMQPQTDSDALACLISSNYLSGYYAGFYDCMRKFQNQNKS